jgi:PilZ domain
MRGPAVSNEVLAVNEGDSAVAKARADRRRFRRVRVDLPGRLFTPADGKEARCQICDLSPGGAAIACDLMPPEGTQVVLYVDGFGRFEGQVTRLDESNFGVYFSCTPLKRERTAEQLTLFLNKSLVDESALRRHERTSHKGFAKFTRADGQIVHGEVMDISAGGVSLKTDVRPAIGEFVLIAQMAGRVARHHEHGIGIEFVGQDKSANAEPAARLNLVR